MISLDLIKLRTILNNSGLQKDNNALYQVINEIISFNLALSEAITQFTPESGVWAPTLTFATPGNLAVVYSIRMGYWTRTNDIITATYLLATSTFTHTTAAGTLRVAGLPFISTTNNRNIFFGATQITGYTKAGYTSVVNRIDPNTSFMTFVASGSAVTSAQLAPADMPTGGVVVLGGTITYQAKLNEDTPV